jgi:hypothetical protein
MEKYIKIDSWVDQIIVDPLGKGPIKKSQNNKLLLTDYEKTTFIPQNKSFDKNSFEKAW